jgi:hypothetical protein
MLLSPQRTAVLATFAVVCVALFPSGVGPFTATHGPATAERGAAVLVLEFALVSFVPPALISNIDSQIRKPVCSLPVVGPGRSLILALRC